MAIVAEIPPSTAEFRISVEGFLDEERLLVQGFHVERSANKIPYAIISILDGSYADQDYAETSGNQLVPGNMVTLYTGSVDEKKLLFEGIIISQKIIQNEQGTSLELTVKDVAVRMTVGRKNAYYFQKTDTEILKEVLSRYQTKGITANVDTAHIDVTHEEMVQYYCTDWDFLVSRAEASGRLVLVENGTVQIVTPQTITSDTNFSLVFAENTYSFEAEMDARNEYEQVTARSWDFAERKLTVEDQTDAAGFEAEGNIPAETLAQDVIGLDDYLMQHGGDLSSDELKLWAYSKMLRSRLSKIRGRAQVGGTHEVKVGDNINVSKFTGRFDGTAYVTGVSHEMNGKSTWFTNIQFGYTQEWFAQKYNDIIDRPAAGLLPAVNGLMIGIVTDIRSEGDDGDPEGNHRVQVKMPLVNNDENKGVWARVATLDAGENHGVFFRPEVGDEVILGFLDDDPRQPIILGSLFSSQKAVPPNTIGSNSENFNKVIYTKTGLNLAFNDETETITLGTKDDKNKIVITATESPTISIVDQNNNKIEMSDKGIVIESGKDLTLKAPTGDVTIEGLNIEGSASAQLTMDGSASTEVSSSGSMTIRGSVVQIN